VSLEAQADVSDGFAGRQLAEHQVEKQVVTAQFAHMIVTVVLADYAVKLVSRDKIGHLGENVPTLVHNLAALRPQNYFSISNQKIKEHL
jgi:hypothetical protein